MRMFLRKPAVERDPLAVTMSGVRSGERALQIGAGDPRLVGRIAAKVGMTGTAAIVVDSERAGARMRSAVDNAGALADVHVALQPQLPFADAAFDVVVVHEGSHSFTGSDGGQRARWFGECRRVLREGGRLVTIEQASSGALRRLLRGEPESAADGGGTVAALKSAGFPTVRLLAEREGYRFVEAFNTR